MKTSARILVLLLLIFALLSSKAYAQGDGTLDVTYGTGGRVLLPVPGFFQGAYMALDSKDHVVLCGLVDEAIYATRLLPDGQVDASFGNGGITIVDPINPSASQDLYVALALPGDKTLIVTNVYDDSIDQTCMVMLDATGNLDPSFGGTGVVYFDFNPGNAEEYLLSGLVQPDGKIVLAGYTVSPSTDLPQGLVVRLNPNGTLDNTFNGSGRFDAPALFPILYAGIALQPDGKIVATGSTLDLATFSFTGLMTRINPNGQIDLSFGQAGFLRLTSLALQFNLAFDIQRASDGKWVLLGTTFPDLNAVSVARLNTNGSVDNTFGTNGTATLSTAAGSVTEIFPVRCRLQTDGRILALATVVIDSVEGGYLLTRLTSSGQIDSTFAGGTGSVLETGDQSAFDLALQSDGKILVSGSYFTSADQGFFVHRYNNQSVRTKEARLALGEVCVFPNPAREQATVQFSPPQTQRLQIDLTDALGRIVASIAPMREWDAGLNALPFDLPSVPAGLYWLRFQDERGRTRVAPLRVVAR